jgi:hypothetical protein
MEGGRARISLEFVRESEILDPRDATFFVRRTIVPRFSLPLAKVVPYRAPSAPFISLPSGCAPGIER